MRLRHETTDTTFGHDILRFSLSRDLLPREALVAGLAFMEGALAGSLDRDGLCAWFDELLEAFEAETPASVRETDSVSAPLRLPPRRDHHVAEAMLAQVVEAARANVASALRGLQGSEACQGFVMEAVRAGRVQEREIWPERRTRWVPVIDSRQSLSTVVLSLFAADFMNHREQYARELRVCPDCGRPSFDRSAPTPCACQTHGNFWAAGARATGAASGPLEAAIREAKRAVRATACGAT
jgi:ribosomal protein L37AE/L43A